MSTLVLGAILLTGYLGGPICTHWPVGDPCFVQAGLDVLVRLGIYMREVLLERLIPLARS